MTQAPGRARRDARRPGRRAPHLPIVSSKIVAPDGPDRAAVRSRLLAALDSPEPITLVVAPAGYGKTVAVAHWVRDRELGDRTAWVSLDVLDRNPLSMWRHTIAALSTVCPDAAEAHEVLLDRGASDPTFLATLLDAILRLDHRIVLVLDDLHEVSDPEVARQLALLVDRAAGALRLVITSRVDPHLPIARWRADGRVSEIRAADLAFTDDEAVDLLERFGALGLSDDEIGRLNEHAEGWAVGLLLAGRAIELHPDHRRHLNAVLASDQLLTDYLAAEVLSGLSPLEQDLALALSVVPTFDLATAAAVSGHTDPDQALQSLLRSSVFLEATPPPARTYRFHGLFRDLLQVEIARRDPAALEAARTRAIDHAIASGDLALALDLLVATGDLDRAFDLVVKPILRLVDDGASRRLARWMDMLDGFRPAGAEQTVAFAVGHLNTGRWADAVRWCDIADDMATDDDTQVPLRSHVVRMIVHVATGDVRAAVDTVPRDVRAARQWPLSPGHDAAMLEARWPGFDARARILLGDLEGAADAVERLRDSGVTVPVDILCPALDGWIAFEHGDVRAARVAAEHAVEVAESRGVRPHHAATDALHVAARCQIERLALAEATRTCESALEDATTIQAPIHEFLTRVVRADLDVLTDGWPTALRGLELARARLDDRLRGACRDRLVAAHARTLLGCGRPDDAAALVTALPMGTSTQLLRARIALQRHEYAQVEALLADASTGTTGERIEAHLIAAQSFTGTAADASLRAALALADRSGHLAVFLREGPALERVLARVPIADLHPELAAFFATRITASEAQTPPVVEALTQREQSILEYLPTHLTYADIGASLYVSVNTIKTNLRAIYRKLGVSSRADAVEVARRAGLLRDRQVAPRATTYR